MDYQLELVTGYILTEVAAFCPCSIPFTEGKLEAFRVASPLAFRKQLV